MLEFSKWLWSWDDKASGEKYKVYNVILWQPMLCVRRIWSHGQNLTIMPLKASLCSTDEASPSGDERAEKTFGLYLWGQHYTLEMEVAKGAESSVQREVRLLQTILLIVRPIPWCNWAFLEQPFRFMGTSCGVMFHFISLVVKLLTAQKFRSVTISEHIGGKVFAS